MVMAMPVLIMMVVMFMSAMTMFIVMVFMLTMTMFIVMMFVLILAMTMLIMMVMLMMVMTATGTVRPMAMPVAFMVMAVPMLPAFMVMAMPMLPAFMMMAMAAFPVAMLPIPVVVMPLFRIPACFQFRHHFRFQIFRALYGLQNIFSVQFFPWRGNDGRFLVMLSDKRKARI